MEKTIVVEPLQKRFTVQIKNANRDARNRSYANASNCCGVPLKQEKRCGNCNELVSSKDSSRKIIKIGKESHLIEASALKQVQEQLEQMEELTIHTFKHGAPIDAEDRFDSLSYALPEEKKEAQYKELAELLSGRCGIGKGVFGSNEFQLLFSVGADGIIRVRKLIEESQRYDFEPEKVREQLASIELPQNVIALEKQILDRKMVAEFDIKQFRDMRADFEERIIEDYVLNGTVPEVAKQVDEQRNDDELTRLQSLLNSQ